MNAINSHKIPLFSVFIITVILIVSIILPLKNAKGESTKEENIVESTEGEGNKEENIVESTEDESVVKGKSTKNENKKNNQKPENMRVKITPSMAFLDVNHNGKIVRIQRVQDKDYKLTNSYARTARSCPPFCIRPIQLSDDIKTVGELEVIMFLKDKVANDKGILVDSRLEDWHVKGTIPGSVSIPFTMFTGGLEDINTVRLLELFDVKEDKEDNWNFDEAIELMLFCNGAWCGQSQKAIKYLLKLGYPAEKLYWYRGGMQAWQSFGLTVIKP